MPDNHLENHATRGRRDPELAAAMLEDDNESLSDYGDDPGQDQAYFGLLEGDQLVAKVAYMADTPLGEAWYTFGSTTRQAPDESSEEASERLLEFVTEKAFELGGLMTEKATAIRAAAVEQQRRQRISTRSRG